MPQDLWLTLGADARVRDGESPAGPSGRNWAHPVGKPGSCRGLFDPPALTMFMNCSGLSWLTPAHGMALPSPWARHRATSSSHISRLHSTWGITVLA